VREEDIDIDEIEKKHRTMATEPVHFNNATARSRHAVLCSDYAQIVRIRAPGLSKSPLPLHVFQTLLGEPVGYIEETTQNAVVLPTFQASTVLGENDRALWKKRTYEFAVGLLICMASSVSVKYGNQSVSLLGTMIPASSFM
jgi:hypothetical protein